LVTLTKLSLNVDCLICITCSLEQGVTFVARRLSVRALTHILGKLLKPRLERLCLLESPALQSHRTLLLTNCLYVSVQMIAET
ncbi:hypothetical protein, partial [Bradyrhizobium arachidis]|uniref:hypothetical protein n=1 Tax=Bradyrhizobium arachidis TaxID=858423 RepID=UPI0008EFF6C7